MKRFFNSYLIVTIETPTSTVTQQFDVSVKVPDAIDYLCKSYLIPEDNIIKITSSFVRNYHLKPE